jgi:tRNA nucleotidyltransferase/poly(A) polymerase
MPLLGNNENGQKGDTSAAIDTHRGAQRHKLVVPEHLSSKPRYQAAGSIVQSLRNAQFEAYFVGGFVRDLVLATTSEALNPPARPIDIDIASSADPAEIRKLFRNSHFVGQIFGVSMVDIGAHCFEVATFRNEGTYSDGRRPDSVTKGVLETDACRRDFTVNALYFDPIENTVLDFHGGIHDAVSRIIRTVGNPDQRFSEDRLRIIRMCRFASTLGFRIDEETWKAACLASPNVVSLSRERILIEIKKTPGFAVRHFLELLKLLNLDELLWKTPFDSIPVWQKNPECRKNLESLVEHDSHYPAAFVLLASWENFLKLDQKSRKNDVAERQSWPTTVQDRKLLGSLMQLVQLFDYLPATENAEAKELMTWSLALISVCQKLPPLTATDILHLANMIVHGTKHDPRSSTVFSTLMTVAMAAVNESDQSAGEFLNSHFSTIDLSNSDFSKGGIVSLVHRRGYDARYIGFLLGLVRLTAASLKLELAGNNGDSIGAEYIKVLLAFCSDTIAGDEAYPSLLSDYSNLLSRIR